MVVHVEQSVADSHRTAASAAGILFRCIADSVTGAGAGGIELVDNRVNVDAAAGSNGDHAGKADHEVVAAAGASLAEEYLQQRTGIWIKERHTVQGTAAGHQFALHADNIVGYLNDVASFQPGVHRSTLRLFRSQDAQTLTAIAEQGDPLQTLIVSVHIQVLNFLNRELVRHVAGGADGGIDMFLPCGLHVDTLTVIQCHGGYKVIRKIRFICNAGFFHVLLNDSRKNLVIYITAMQRNRTPFVGVCVDWFNASGDTEHGGKCAGRCDGQDLRVAQAVFLNQGGCLFRCVGPEECSAHNLIGMAHGEGTVFLCQQGGRCNGGVRHEKAELIAQSSGFVTSVGDAKLNHHVPQAHDAQTNLTPVADTLALFFKRMEREPLLQHFIQSAHTGGDALLEAFVIKGSMAGKRILYEFRQADTSDKAASACRERFLRARIHAGVGKFLRIGKKVSLPDMIPEQSSRFTIVPVDFSHFVEQLSGVDFLLNFLTGRLAGIMEQERFLFFHAFHKFVADADGNVSLGYFVQIGFQADKFFHVRMGAVDRNHQGAAASVLADQVRDERVQIHEGYSTAGFFGSVVDGGSARRQP